jgi:hypothetical protein
MVIGVALMFGVLSSSDEGGGVGDCIVTSGSWVGVKKNDTALDLCWIERTGGDWECDLSCGFAIAGISPTLRRFFVSGPFVVCQFSDALMDDSVSSAVYILRATAARERRMLSVCQSEGPSYRGIGAGTGPSS